MTSNLTLTGCQGGELLQLYGTHFSSQPFVMAILPISAEQEFGPNPDYSWLAICQQFTVVSDSYATCILPRVDEYSQLQYDVPLMMFMYNSASLTRGNAMFFTFEDMGISIVATSSRSLALVVALPVVLGLLAVAAVVAVVVVLLQRWQRARRLSSDGSTGGDEKEAEPSVRGWWQSRPTLASYSGSDGVELTDA